MNNEFTFVFHSYEADLVKGEAAFHYSIEKEQKILSFVEKITFPPVSEKIPEQLLQSLLQNLLLVLGVSYWKLYCPKKIKIVPFTLSKEQADFWNTVYTKGLGEFFYKNKINFHGLIQFPFEEMKSINPINFHRRDRSLLPIGGGKDSIVSAELLQKHQKPFTAFSVGTSLIQEEVIKLINVESIVIQRILDPQLFSLNKQPDVYNGHVPISLIWAFISIFAATLYDYRYVIVSNEHSANYGNVEYLGEEVNHQWSKSLEFEKHFQSYVKQFIAPSISYFSLLRPFTEIKITKMFTQYNKYFSAFSSCNRNFRIKPSALSHDGRGENSRWCRECPKCVFVFVMLSAYLRKEKVLEIFGKNLFEDEKLLPLIQELLGLGDIKPFECVGTPEEVKYAMYLMYKQGEFKNTPAMKLFAEKAMITEEEAKRLEEELFMDKENKVPVEFTPLSFRARYESE